MGHERDGGTRASPERCEAAGHTAYSGVELGVRPYPTTVVQRRSVWASPCRRPE